MLKLMKSLLPANLANSPITRAEFRHQRYVLQTTRSGWVWIGLALLMLVPALLGSLYYVVLSLFSLPLTDTTGNPTLEGFLTMLTVLMLVMNVAQYLVVTLVTLGLSARSITREKENRTWETLLLTDIDARTLVWGKWWASLQAVWGDHAMIGLLRVGFVGWVIVAFQLVWPAPLFGLSTGIAYFLPVALIALALTAVDAGFTAALGVIAPLSDLPASSTLSIVVALRVALIAGMLALLVVIFDWIQEYGGFHYLLPGLGGLLLFGGATFALLWAGEQIAVRAQVSPVAA